MITDLLAAAQELLGPVIDLRRRIHAQPEVGLQLPVTQGTILEALAGLGLEVSTGTATTSVVGVLEGSRPGPTTLLRGDMDALPMPEDTGLDFSSTVDGAMHACGHDAHVAMLVGAAWLLAGRRHDVPGRVVFMFQPGEEGHGGASLMLEEGLLDRHGHVDRAFAIHVHPVWPSGRVYTRGGPLMASSDDFRVTVRGSGGHASMPNDAVDPVPVACELVTSLQAMVTRRVPIFDPTVLTVSRISAGTTFNVIPEVAVIEGTVRALSAPTRSLVFENLGRVAQHVAEAHLCQAEVETTFDDKPHDDLPVGYPVTVNNASAAERTLDVARTIVGDGGAIRMPNPLMGAEDWSYVLQRVPGSMAFLGVAPPGVERPAPNHSNRMVIDERAMAVGIALHSAMALS
ncbi:MAG TPA: M20 family metallopeptidase [Acidimicrobiales bacterium]|nr:M20 family metallopeptidase [Acidimicrobiales bacterium]